MPRSTATTPAALLKALPEDRRKIISAVRKLVLEHLPDGYEEAVRFGMLSYEVPLSRYPDTYNGQPLGYVALASQKSYCSLYLMGVYQDPKAEAALRQAFEKAGKKLDMGKSCVRFKRLEDLPLEGVGKVIASIPVEKFLAQHEANRRRTK